MFALSHYTSTELHNKEKFSIYSHGERTAWENHTSINVWQRCCLVIGITDWIALSYNGCDWHFNDWNLIAKCLYTIESRDRYLSSIPGLFSKLGFSFSNSWMFSIRQDENRWLNFVRLKRNSAMNKSNTLQMHYNTTLWDLYV